MKYSAGGVTGSLGEALIVEVPLKGKAPPSGGGGQGVAPDNQQAQPAGPVVQEKGDDIVVDPPVRCLPQWEPSPRWGPTPIAGKQGSFFDWAENGCNASTAAMILRWFAEDCPAGKIPFPTKPDGKVARDWYGPRMGECFWPNADPPGKVALDEGGRIDYGWVYDACAHYLQTGELPRDGKGDIARSAKAAMYVVNEPGEGWMSLLKKMLKTGPVIVGLGAPAGHFVVAQAVIGGAVAIVDPGNVLYTAAQGGKGVIQNWQSMASGFADGGSAPDKVRMPAGSQWPEGSAPGQEADKRAYNLVSGDFLKKILDNLHSLTSLTYPDGAKFGAAQASSPQSSQQQNQQQQSQPAPQQQQGPTDRKHDPLAKGDEHENVRVLQFLLNWWQKPQKGLSPVTVSGKLDDPTVALMQKFQKSAGIAPADAPDEATWSALEQQSAEFKLLGNVHPCALPLHTSRKWFGNYKHEGKLSTRLFDQLDYGNGQSGKPILYITKNSTDDDGTSAGGDSTKQSETSLRFDDGTSLDSTQIPYLAIGGAHTHDFGIKPGDVGAVIANGKVAFGVYGDSSGGYHDGTPGDDDMPGVKEKYGTPLFKCHRSGESSVKVHQLLDWGKMETENSAFIWILFPGSSLCDAKGKLPKSVDSDAIQKRGAELLALLTGGSASSQSQQQAQQQQQQQQQAPQQQDPPPQQQDDRPLPDPIQYPGGYDMKSKKQNDGKDWPPSTPGTVVFIRDQKPPQPDAWKGCQFRKHSHFLPDNCVDMNKDSDKDYGHFPDIYGPALPFTPLTQFTMHGFGGVVRCKLENGHVVEFGHFDHITAEVYYAAKEKKQLPAGTYLGKTTSIIGLSNGVHCHMQAVKSDGSRDLLTRDKWLEYFGIPPERRWWQGKK